MNAETKEAKNRTWSQILGSNHYDCRVHGSNVVREVYGHYFIVWPARTPDEARAVLTAWRAEASA